MDIAWYGHAAFRLRGREAAVVMDPCSLETTGFKLNAPTADIVTISRQGDPAHGCFDEVELAPGGYQDPLDAPGEYEIKRVLATGVNTPGPNATRNVAFVITIDEVIVAHLGDLQAMPARAALDELQRAHVCLLPIGGTERHLSPAAAATIANTIGSRLIIPMLYQPERGDVQTGLERLSAFVQEMGLDIKPPTDNHINVTPTNLPTAPTVAPLLARGA